jgi:precorrin-6A/cobalt-precorrin-6A reductase
MRVLLLGGTTEASKLASLLAGQTGISAILSYAGRTKTPQVPEIPYRIGGFGGAGGLAAYLKSERIDVLIDATHPFAEQMSRHAALAASHVNIPLLSLSRPAWRPEAADRWIDASDMAAAAAALGQAPKRVFLTVGRLQIEAFAPAPQHFYLIRAIEPLAPLSCLPHHRVILGRGPFTAEAEEKLMREESIDVIVSKNSGGAATYAKILAARSLGLPVIMVARPRQNAGQILHDPAAVMEFLFRHRATLARRGV